MGSDSYTHPSYVIAAQRIGSGQYTGQLIAMGLGYQFEMEPSGKMIGCSGFQAECKDKVFWNAAEIYKPYIPKTPCCSFICCPF